MSRYQNVIFDLDGTLIDSAPAILASFREVFAATGVPPVHSIDPSVIGPPLRETLTLISGSEDPALLADLAARFAAIYDTTGLLATEAYPGVDAVLRHLAGAGLALSIATNKRIFPTRRILEHMGWDPLFTHIYALDLFEPRLPDKAVYVGDREEDGLAAELNALPFLAATWGYGSLAPEELLPGWGLLAQPADLLEAVA